MARAKYKIGNLVRHGNAELSEIEGVVSMKNGFAYLVAGNVTVTEDQISGAYKEIKPPQPRKPKAEKKPSAKKAA